MRDGKAYLTFLSDFWTSVWSDSKALSASVGAGVDVLNRIYLQTVALAAPEFIEQLPLFREDFWHLVYFGEADRVGGNVFRLANPYHELPFLYNKPFNPTMTIRAGKDYTLVQDGDSTLISFKDDPFKNPRMPIRDVGTAKQILFFSPKTYRDEADLHALFGHLVRIVRPSSEQYRQLVQGVMFIYAHGPILHPLNAGLSLAAGYPVSREFDRVQAIITDGTDYLISTDKNLTYRVPLSATLSVEVGTPLRPLSTFVQDIKVMDWMSEPEWWKGGVGETDPDKRVVNFISQELVPQMNEILRDDPETIDYLFEEYLKYNVLGLKVNTLALGNFNAIEDFFRVLYEVKPHYVAPYTNAYFRVSEVWQTPQDPIEVVEIIELTKQLRPDDPGDAAERWYFPAHVALGGNIRIGIPNELLKVVQNTSYDRPAMHASIEPIHRNMIEGGPCVLNGRRVVGSYPDGGVFERVVLSSASDFVDTYELGSDRVQVILKVENEMGGENFILGAGYKLGDDYGLGYDPIVFGDELLS